MYTLQNYGKNSRIHSYLIKGIYLPKITLYILNIQCVQIYNKDGTFYTQRQFLFNKNDFVLFPLLIMYVLFAFSL